MAKGSAPNQAWLATTTAVLTIGTILLPVGGVIIRGIALFLYAHVNPLVDVVLAASLPELAFTGSVAYGSVLVGLTFAYLWWTSAASIHQQRVGLEDELAEVSTRRDRLHEELRDLGVDALGFLGEDADEDGKSTLRARAAVISAQLVELGHREVSLEEDLRHMPEESRGLIAVLRGRFLDLLRTGPLWRRILAGSLTAAVVTAAMILVPIPYIAAFLVSAYIVAAGLSRIAARDGNVRPSSVIPFAAVAIIICSVVAGMFMQARVAGEFYFAGDQPPSGTLYTVVGESEELLYLVPCDGTKETIAVNPAQVVRVEYSATNSDDSLRNLVLAGSVLYYQRGNPMRLGLHLRCASEPELSTGADSYQVAG